MVSLCGKTSFQQLVTHRRNALNKHTRQRYIAPHRLKNTQLTQYSSRRMTHQDVMCNLDHSLTKLFVLIKTRTAFKTDTLNWEIINLTISRSSLFN